MTLKFLGIIPNTPTDESPTIWLHEETGDLLIQSYKATEAGVMRAQPVRPSSRRASAGWLR